MESSVLGSARSTSDETMVAARRAVLLGELRLAQRRLQTPRWRVHGLLALIAAAKRSGLATRTMESELRVTLDAWLASRHGRAPAMVRNVVRGQLEHWLEKGTRCPRGTRLQDLTESLASPGPLSAFDCAGAMLAAGDVEAARRLADRSTDPTLRHRLAALVTTGVSGWGGRRRFVGQPFDETYPPSLPRVVAMLRAAQPGVPLKAARWTMAEALLTRLRPADRQQALAHAAAAAYHADGYAAGVRQVRTIRYQDCRQLAWLNLLVACLAAGRLDEAWRAFGELRCGAFRERGRLVLARELVRRGRRRRAQRLLGHPVMAARFEEHALLLFEIDGRFLRRARHPGRSVVCSEDLSVFDPALPSLAHRRATVAWRALFDRLDLDDCRFLTARTAGLLRRDLHRLIGERAARRYWLRTIVAEPSRLEAVLRAVRVIAPGVDEALWSESLSIRASRLASERGDRLALHGAEALVSGWIEGMGLQGTDRSRRAESRAVAVERSLQDEGVSWSPRARSRRRVVLGAIKHCLKTWLVDDVEPLDGALSSRLRTLSNLGGGLATEQLVRVLDSVRRPNASFLPAVAVLIALDPRRAARMIFSRQLDGLLGCPRQSREILLALEDHGALEAGFTSAWDRFVGGVRDRLGDRRAEAWLRQWITAWPGRTVPTLATLDCSVAELAEGWVATGDRLISRCEERLDGLLSLPTERLPGALAEDPMAIRLLHWLRPDALSRSGLASRSGRSSLESEWRLDCRALHRGLGEIDPSIVRRLARSLVPRERVDHLADRLLAGAHPVADASRVVDLPDHADAADHRLVFLDKRRDFFTFLRFADCVKCCFNRSNRRYRMDSMRPWLLSVWKDPLSYCFHVERRDPRTGWRPRGFVFGAFSLGTDGPAILLNGIYLTRQDWVLRAAILTAIEETFCRPLGIHRVAVANRHAGCGRMPVEYVQRPATVFRLRALRSASGPVSTIYDDISTKVNQTETVDDLYWRQLVRRVAG